MCNLIFPTGKLSEFLIFLRVQEFSKYDDTHVFSHQYSLDFIMPFHSVTQVFQRNFLKLHVDLDVQGLSSVSHIFSSFISVFLFYALRYLSQFISWATNWVLTLTNISTNLSFNLTKNVCTEITFNSRKLTLILPWVLIMFFKLAFGSSSLYFTGFGFWFILTDLHISSFWLPLILFFYGV